MAKKSLAILIAVLMLAGMIAGCAAPAPSTSSTTAANTTTTKAATTAGTTAAATTTTTAATTAAPATGGLLFSEPVTLKMWMIEHSSYLYDPENFLEKKMGEKLNVFFDVTPFQTGINEKINLGLASGDLPDLAHNFGVIDASNWGQQGALVDFTDHFDKMPNYQAWASNMGEYPFYFYSADGSMYVTPNYGYGEASNGTFWVYRRDLFEKLNLSVPKDDAELYDALKALKAEYPESYPFCNRSWLGIIDRIAWQWGSGHPMYYKNEASAWVYGPTEAGYEECIAWLAMLYAEELMPPNILSLDTAGWQELVSTNKGFVFSEYQQRIDFYNNPMRQDNPEVTFAFMEPFKGGANGVATFNPQTMLIISGYVAFSNSKYVNEMVTLLDWMYTDEAKNLMSWGVEGESYVVNPDGSKSHIGIKQGDSGFSATLLYGFFQRGFYLLTDAAAHNTYASVETLEAIDKLTQYRGEYRIPSISFSEQNKEAYDRLNEPINTMMTENIGKFVTNQRPMSEYASFINDLKAIGLDELIALYNKQQAEIDASR